MGYSSAHFKILKGEATPQSKNKQNLKIRLRWSRFPGQFGGKAKVDSGFNYAASFSSFSCIA